MADDESIAQASEAARAVAARVLLRHKMDQWKECANGRDRHAIWSQISILLWDTGVFRIVVRARSLAERDEHGNPLVNGAMHRMLDVGFYQGQLLAIRRLTDPGERDFDHPKAVFSLKWLIRDMKDHRELLTRENLFAMAAIPMEESVANAAAREIERKAFERGDTTGVWIPHSADAARVRELQALIDELARVRPAERTPDDMVSLAFFQGLETKLAKATAIIRLYADKFVAHASSPSNRQQSTIAEASVQLKHIEEAHEILCRCFNCIDQLLQLSRVQHQYLPTPSIRPEALMDRALITSADLPKLAGTWAEFEMNTQEWGMTGMSWATT